MDLQKYNFRLKPMGRHPRILFTFNGKECYRTILDAGELEEEFILSSLCDYIETGKCTIKPIPSGFISIRTQICKAEELASVDDTYEALLSEYETDIKVLQNKLEEALTTISNLSSNLSYLKLKKTDSEFKSNEELECIMEVLNDYYEDVYRTNPFSTLRKEVLKDFLERNSFKSRKKEISAHLKQTLRSSYSTTSGFDIPKLKRGLNEVGLDVLTQVDGHYKVVVIGYEQCSTSLSRTPSDGRGLDNSVREILTLLYR